MKVAVSGLNGFLGSHLKECLESKDYEVVGIGRDILVNPVEITQFLIDNQPDYIVHLASYGNHYNQKDEVEIFLANAVKTFMLLYACNTYKYKGFINVSSSSVYGSKEKPMKEDMSLDTDTFYGASKVSGEYMARAFAKQYDRPIVTVRPFSIFGTGEGEHRFIPTVIRSITEGESITLDPSPKHDWLHASDFCDALILIMENADKLKGEVINIGSGEQYSNKEMVEKIEWILDKPATFTVKEKQRKYDTKNWVADNTKLTKLGWKPKYNIMRGLKRTISVKTYVYD